MPSSTQKVSNHSPFQCVALKLIRAREQKSTQTAWPDDLPDELLQQLAELKHDKQALRCLLTAHPGEVFKSQSGHKFEHRLERTQETLDIKLYYPNAELFPHGGALKNHRAVIVARGPSLKPPVIIGRKIKGGWERETLRVWRPSTGFDCTAVVRKTVVGKIKGRRAVRYRAYHKYNEAEDSDDESNTESDATPFSHHGNRNAEQPATPNSPIITPAESDIAQTSSRSASMPTESIYEQIRSIPSSAHSDGFTPSTRSTSEYSAPTNIKTESQPDQECMPLSQIEHIVQFKFIDKNNREVRQKPLKYCNTIGKLFAQARMGKILGQIQDDTILSAQVDGQEEMFIAYDDDEQFSALIEMITEVASRGSGGSSGEAKVCFVEIRVARD
jgi:hypothetical protein